MLKLKISLKMRTVTDKVLERLLVEEILNHLEALREELLDLGNEPTDIATTSTTTTRANRTARAQPVGERRREEIGLNLLVALLYIVVGAAFAHCEQDRQVVGRLLEHVLVDDVAHLLAPVLVVLA